MTDAQLMEAVATGQGYTHIYQDGTRFVGIPPTGNYVASMEFAHDSSGGVFLPPWLTSHDAAHEVVMTMSDDEKDDWTDEMEQLIYKTQGPGRWRRD